MNKEQNLEIVRSNIPVNKHLLAMGSEVLNPLTCAFSKAKDTIDRLAEVADPHLVNRIEKLSQSLKTYEPSVTLVGQVKAGKSALTNIMAGAPELLPSDVNPWTSVVTTLHLSPKEHEVRTKAKFTFFDDAEWAGLVVKGGRLGELAARAGANEEMENIQSQIDKMRKQAQTRLGSSFEALLGQTHKYGYYDRELIERYVCMGEDDAIKDDPSNKQGRFADITRTAELFIHQPQLSMPLILRDTPGVNDTFMVREQITLESLRSSEICLVVLSAHQALNTTDMALTRMISNLERRQIVFFVNRIDELEKPSEQIPEIRKSIISTLKDHNVLSDCEIVFGSAKWAEIALRDELGLLNGENRDVLLDWAQGIEVPNDIDACTHTWILSGLPQLMRTINQLILEGSGQRMLDSIWVQIKNLAAEMKMQKIVSLAGADTATGPRLEQDELVQALGTLTTDHENTMREATDKLLADLKPRLERVQASFVRRATDALITHLERHGEQDTWQYESTGLRMLLRSTYAQFVIMTKRQMNTLYINAASDIEDLYVNGLGGHVNDFRIEPPVVPVIPPPVVLGKAIALDMNSTWWRRWWQKRKGFEAFANDYADLIQREVASITDDLVQTQVMEVFEMMEKTLQEFVKDQRESLLRLSSGNNAAPAQTAALQIEKENVIASIFEDALSELNQTAA